MFAVSIKDIQYLAHKEARSETDRKSVVSQKYYHFLVIFSKNNLDTLSPHRKYDHKILPEKEYKLGHISLYNMCLKNLISFNDISTLIQSNNSFK